jgi:putative transposase
MSNRRGGRRPGAGRKRTSRSVKHRRRPPHALRYPSHVTVTFVRSLGSLRQQRIFETLREIFRRPKIAGFQVCQFSIQTDHVHLVVEATNRKAFSSGMRSLSIRCGLGLNGLFERKRGKVVRDRYHRRDLFTARQVRTVLRYVLLNGHKHGVVAEGMLDPFSSASSFDGWLVLYTLDDDLQPRATGDPLLALPPEARGARPVKAWSKLLGEEWREHGLISPFEGLKWQLRANLRLRR